MNVKPADGEATLTERRLISIVVPMLNEAEGLTALLERLHPVLADLEARYRFEVLFIDDGSTDGSFEMIRRLATEDARIRAIRLSRNFGSHLAITAGLEHALGDAAIILTADLQEPPESIPAFIARWEEGNQIVWGVRAQRNDEGRLDHAFSRAFTAVTRSGPEMRGYPEEGPSAYLLADRVVIESMRGFGERNRMILGVLAWTGFQTTTLEYVQEARHAGKSNWSVGKKVKLTVDALVSFSYTPIRIASLLGIIISVVAFLYAAVIVVLAATGTVTATGFPTLLAVVLFLGGVQLLFLGILGEYLWRALDEARHRPLYLIAEQVPAPSTAPRRTSN